MTQEKKLLVPSAGCMTNILLIAPFLQLLFCLHTIEPFLFGGVDDTFLHFSLFLVSCFAAYMLLIVFFRIAKTWQKWIMYIYVAVLVLQTGVGLMYDYYEPPVERFTKEDINSIEAFIKGNEKLPDNMQVLAWNDSVGIIGKKANDGVLGFLPRGQFESKIDMPISFFRNKICSPDDIFTYLELLGIKESDAASISEDGVFWALKYPNMYVYIYIKNCDCGIVGEDFSPCYFYFDEHFFRGLDSFDPIIWEIIEGKLDDRYRNFYKFFQKLIHPTYVRTDLANDPYFLIYQGKYEEARAGLKDLPPARREFCKKKLEALGY